MNITNIYLKIEGTEEYDVSFTSADFLLQLILIPNSTPQSSHW